MTRGRSNDPERTSDMGFFPLLLPERGKGGLSVLCVCVFLLFLLSPAA